MFDEVHGGGYKLEAVLVREANWRRPSDQMERRDDVRRLHQLHLSCRRLLHL